MATGGQRKYPDDQCSNPMSGGIPLAEVPFSKELSLYHHRVIVMFSDPLCRRAGDDQWRMMDNAGHRGMVQAALFAIVT